MIDEALIATGNVITVFARHQSLYWYQPTADPVMAIRRGKHSMLAHRDFEYPRDVEGIANVERQIEDVLRKANSPELTPWITRTDYFYRQFKNMDAERLRWKFMRLNMFQESWIPTMKSGGYRRFELYDLSTDPGQKKDVSAQFPDVAGRLKKEMLDITTSVMAEGPDWHLM